jgi:HNH endonuclease/Homing endonuclease associated repeat
MPKFETNFLDDYSDASLLAEIKRVAALHAGPSLPITTFKKLSQRVSASTIRRRFGTWQIALAKAGFGHLYCGVAVSNKMKTQTAKRFSKDDLIAELHRVHGIVGMAHLTASDFDTYSIIGRSAVRNRFGSWQNGLDAAGIAQSNLARRYSDEACYENLANVWMHYGRQPQHQEINRPPSVVGSKAYIIRWGTWRKSVKAFVDWANAEDVIPTIKATSAVQPITLAHLEDDCREVQGLKPARLEEDCREVRPGLRFRVFQRDRFRCVACGRSPATDLNVVLHADHITPVALGGKTVLENLQSLCEACNLGKGKRQG